MSPPAFAIRSRNVVTPAGILAATVLVRDGRIEAVVPDGEPLLDRAPSHIDAQPGAAPPERLLDAGDRWLLPGLVDTHVHVNDPGRSDWEGFPTALRAAAAGGITTIVDMPLNSLPPTTTAAALACKRDAYAAGAGAVEKAGAVAPAVEFWGGVVPGNVAELEPLAAAGVRGFKCFLSPSGVDEFGHVAESDLDAAMPVIARLGLPLLAHAELPAALVPPTPGADPRAHATWLATRPPAAEVEAIRLLIRLAARHRCRVHVVHLATADALPDLRAARAAGVPITVETCPHYLCFAAEEIPDGATELKCAPPIRGRDDREALWLALATGDVDLVATDHSPAPPALKHLEWGNFLAAWGGIASLELALPAVWTEARARGFGPEHLALWMSARPALLAGLARAGAIAPGRDADLVVFDPAPEWIVDPDRLRQRHPVTPYAARRLRGRVEATWRRGRLAFERTGFVAAL